MSLSWYWPLANRGTAGGRQDLGIDDFGDDPLGNLSREIIQNSLDARSGEGPVKVEFSLFKASADSFNGLGDYFDYIVGWINEDNKRKQSETKEREFMDRIIKALREAEKNGIIWLRISDRNTKGLCGVSNPVERQKPWFAFINGSGKDVKEDGSGGSKGLGKASIFLNSEIRTIFVSTSTIDGELGNIGYARLVAKDVIDDGTGNRDWTQGIGYCVSEEAKAKKLNTPNNGLLNLDPEFTRENNDFGTDIFVPFFRVEDGWASKMIGEAIISFLPAIFDGDLEVAIKDSLKNYNYSINKDNLSLNIKRQDYFDNEKQGKIAFELYKTLMDPSHRLKSKADTSRELEILISTNPITALNRVYTYRWKTKMKIRDFRTNSSLPYTAIILIKGDEICNELKSVEDASHRKWSKEKYKETNYCKDVIYQAVDSIKEFAENELSKIESANFKGSSDFEWASNEGWKSDSDSDTLDGTANEDLGLPTEEIRFEISKKKPSTTKKKPRKPKATVFEDDGDAEGYVEGLGIENENGEDIGSHPEGQNAGGTNSPHPGEIENSIYEDEDGQKMMIRKPVSTISSKMPAKNLDEGLFELTFSPSKSGEDVEIEILRSGYGSDSEPTTILEASLDSEYLKTSKNKIYLSSIKKGETYRIRLKLKEHKIYVWEVNINANE